MSGSGRVVSSSIVVEAPPEVVFAILADPRQHARIDGSGSVRDTVSGPERLSRGATFGVDMKLAGLPYRISNRVVEFEEGRRIAWRHFGGHRWRYELEPEGDGTRVTESFDYSMYAAPQRLLIEALGFPGRNRRGIEETLRTLKVVAEADGREPVREGGS
ncbi:dimethyladenosine transferase [Phycicoccus sp. Root563]|uniref:SRPBCC family protein n=1 Tax=Phycicoccus sp. Root563 TaxID=1736562 RepID=UPI000703BB75|nr:SRPBCC family protein [Phycicoccus sp. Root563]KQZ88939.1 dimethyladenosine transferase [Phycicoccus sp. Root563]